MRWTKFLLPKKWTPWIALILAMSPFIGQGAPLSPLQQNLSLLEELASTETKEALRELKTQASDLRSTCFKLGRLEATLTDLGAHLEVHQKSFSKVLLNTGKALYGKGMLLKHHCGLRSSREKASHTIDPKMLQNTLQLLEKDLLSIKELSAKLKSH